MTETQQTLLQRTLEKLFGGEELNRTEHIQYVVDLLTSEQTDQYLEGLKIDLSDFKPQSDHVITKPAALILSRQHKISENPITWYVNSIAQISTVRRKCFDLEYHSLESSNLSDCSSRYETGTF